MSLLAATAAAMLLVAAPGAGSSSSSDASRLAATGGFLLGNAHRCGIATDRVVRAGQLIQTLIVAAARDGQDEEAATERFAKFFMATAVPDKAADKLVASCDTVSSEFQKLEGHQIAAEASKSVGESKNTAGNTAPPRFRLGDGE